MSSGSNPRPGRECLVVLCGDGTAGFFSGLNTQRDVIADWLTKRTHEVDRFPIVSWEPQGKRDFQQIIEHIGEVAEDADIFLYLSGHGRVGESGVHRLVLEESGDDLGRAFETSRLVTAVLESIAANVFIVIDSCHSGALLDELLPRLKEFDSLHRESGRRVAILSASEFDQKPRIGEFTGLLKAAIEWLSAPERRTPQRYFSPHQLSEALQRASHGTLGSIEPIWISRRPPSIDGHACLPNPTWPGLDLLHDVALPAHAQLLADALLLDAYWVDKGSGRFTTADTAWRFSGREEIAERIREFLGPDAIGSMVITGSAGSGKSSILARTALLSDALFRSHFVSVVEGTPGPLLPPIGSIAIAVVASNKDEHTLALEILALLGKASVDAPSPIGAIELLISSIRDLPPGLVILVDAVDEALSPPVLIQELIARLADPVESGGASARMLLGVRSSGWAGTIGVADPGDELLRLLESQVANLDVLRSDGLDAVPAIEAYVRRALEGSVAYVENDDISRGTAQIIASRVAPSFLDARLATQALLELEEPQSLQDQGWLDSLKDGTLALLSADLTAVSTSTDVPVELLAASLRALAFAYSPGIPWETIWPAFSASMLTNGASGRDVSEAIRTVVGSRLAGYLVRDISDERYVFRLNHKRLNEILALEPHRILGLEESEPSIFADVESAISAIAMAIPGLVDPQEGTPHPYLQSHALRHVADAGMLSTLSIPAAYFPWDRSSIAAVTLGLVRTTEPPRTYTGAWAIINADVLDEDFSQRQDRFELACLSLGLEPPKRQQAIARGLWVRRRSRSFSVVLSAGAPVTSLAFGVPLRTSLNQRRELLLLIGTAQGMVFQVSGSDGSILAATRVSSEPIVSLSLTDPDVIFDGAVDRSSYVEAFTRDGRVVSLEPSRGIILATLERRVHTSLVGQIGSRHGRITLTSKGSIGLWETPSGTALHRGATRLARPSQLALARSDEGEDLLVVGNPSGELEIFELPRLTRRGYAKTSVEAWASMLSLGTVAVGVGRAGTLVMDRLRLQVWDTVSSRAPKRGPDRQVDHDAGLPVAVAVADSRTLYIAKFAGEDLTLTETNTESRPGSQRLAWRVNAEHRATITSLMGRFDRGELLLASADAAGIVKFWAPHSHEASRPEIAEHLGPVTCFATMLMRDSRVLATGGLDGTVRVWDAATGLAVTRWKSLTKAPLLRIAGARRAGDPVFVVATNTDILVVEIGRRRPLKVSPGRVSGHVHALAARNELVAWSASGDTVRMLDLETGLYRSRPITGNDKSVRSMAFGRGVFNGTVVCGDRDGGLRAWHFDSGQWDPLWSGSGSVTHLQYSDEDGPQLLGLVTKNGASCRVHVLNDEYLEVAQPIAERDVVGISLGTSKGRARLLVARRSGRVSCFVLEDATWSPDGDFHTWSGVRHAGAIPATPLSMILVGDNGVTRIDGNP